MLRLTSLPKNIQERLETICHLANKQDENSLLEMMNNDISITANYSGIDAVCLLANAGNVAAVDFLLDKFEANIVSAFIGYALGKHVEECEKIRDLGLAPHFFLTAKAIWKKDAEVEASLRVGTQAIGAIMGYVITRNFRVLEQLFNQELLNLDHILYTCALFGEQEMISSIDADENKFIKAYAYAGHVRAEFLCQQSDDNKNFALRGYAEGAHHDKVNQLIEQGVPPHYAFIGYAISGQFKQFNRLMEMFRAPELEIKDNVAIDLASLEGYIAEVPFNTLRALSSINDTPIRESLAKEIDKLNSLKKAEKLNELMLYYGLSFNQALVLSRLSLTQTIWLLQGTCLVNNKTIPAEMFMHISSFLLDLSSHDTNKLFSALHKKLYFDSVISITNKANLGLFSSQIAAEEKREAAKRYEKRII